MQNLVHVCGIFIYMVESFHSYTLNRLRTMKENEAWSCAEIHHNVHTKMGSAVFMQGIIIAYRGLLLWSTHSSGLSFIAVLS